MSNAARLIKTLAAVCLAGVALVSSSGCGRAEARSAHVDYLMPKLSDSFDAPTTVAESMLATKSASAVWWLSSGAGLVVADGVGSTLVGVAPEGYFRSRYALRNPRDTDGGVHPQNLFRLVTRGAWRGDTLQQCYFKVLDYHVSDSPQRYAPNGLLLFTRYTDENDLYYAGVRVDGHAVVKKKSAGTYYTLAETPVFPGAYDRDTNPFLLPRDAWLGLRVVTADQPDGSVVVSLFVDRNRSGKWELVLRGIDAGVGGAPFRVGRTGIRTDFMDVQFDDYRLQTADVLDTGVAPE